MRRKHVVLIALIAVVLLLAAVAPVAATAVRVGAAYDAPVVEGTFGFIAHQGVVAAEGDLPIKVKEVDPWTVRGDFIPPEEQVESLLSRSDLIIGVGFLYTGAFEMFAPDRPDIDFALIDSFVDLPNVASIAFASNEGSFLMGAAAALTSENDTIGFIGGVDIPIIFEFEAGFVAGVHHINPDAEVLIEYISEWPDLSGFGDPGRAYELAMDMYDDGADVVYHAAGFSGFGLFAAADEFSAANDHVWAIGVDTDQYLVVGPEQAEHILTSMLKRVDVAAYDMIEAEVDGTFTGGLHWYDLAADGVGYATTGGFLDSIIDELEALKAQIIDGSIVVPSWP